MCLAAGIPLVDGGTAGTVGQVRAIIKVGITHLPPVPRPRAGGWSGQQRNGVLTRECRVALPLLPSYECAPAYSWLLLDCLVILRASCLSAMHDLHSAFHLVFARLMVLPISFVASASCAQGVTPCYECLPLATPKQFAVCTIRAKPTTPLHCIVWAKMLYGSAFLQGKYEDDGGGWGAGRREFPERE